MFGGLEQGRRSNTTNPCALLGGSWVVINGVTSPLIRVIVIAIVTLIIAPLIRLWWAFGGL